MNNFAPVLIPTLNRHVHFKRCVESLSACTHADKTDLFISLDYPLKDNHWEGYELIKAYLPTIKGFKTINVIEREKNYGAVDNFFKSLEYIFERHNRLIFSEDDNVFAPDFLSFVNKGLEVYQDRDDVFSVSGYQYPVTIPKSYDKDIYIWQGFSAWGVGLWRTKWKKVNFEHAFALDTVKNFLKNYKDVYQLQKIANRYLPAMIEMIKKQIIHGDGLICFYLFQNKMYSIFPTISRVRNTGHDGSGEHCGYMTTDTYREQDLYYGDSIYEMPRGINPDTSLNKLLYQHFTIPLKTKIKTLVRLLLINSSL